MSYRLGLDLGTNSIGWCVLDLSAKGRPRAIRDIGVRIFSDGRDPQSGTSLAVDRRVARGMRRRRDRYLLRRKDLMDALIRFGLMPAAEAERKALEKLDPYELRARGLDEKLSLDELGRAIFHLSQRRGFRSNRKTDKSGDDKKEKGKIKAAADKLTAAMEREQARTLGEFLYRRHKQRKPVRARLMGEGAKAEYDFYPQRHMLEAEFGALWKAQACCYAPELTDEKRDVLRAILFRQRPLRPVDPGKCALDPAKDKSDLGGYRAPWALPLAQRFRIYKELANLRIIRRDRTERPLTADERDKAAAELFRRQKLTFKAMRKPKMLNLTSDERFNLESKKRDHLKGDETAAILSKDGRFGKDWHELGDGRQAEIVEKLLSDADDDAVVGWLTAECGLPPEAARAVADAPLREGHCRLGRLALNRIVPIMRDENADWADPETGEVRPRPLRDDEAAARAGYHHSDRRPEDVLDRLPYYGEALAHHVSGSGDPEDSDEARFGRIPNPTVHIGLNQARRLLNALIESHGAPGEIVVELARELKLSREQKDEIQKEQAENQKKNDRRRTKLAELGQADNGENRMRMRLWEELNPDNPLDRRCVYTGEQISIDRLFSAAIEVDHILPFSRTLDNSAANRTVSMRHANRAKTNQSPFEAFGHSPTIGGHKYDWDAILGRVAGLAKNKQWRFGPDAMKRFEDQERDFLDRQLTDTAYLARVAKEYLSHVCDPNQVRAIPGRLTALLRGKWGLNSLLSDANLKNRTDHRHHAIDAVVAAVTDRSMLQRIATAAGESRERLIESMPDPWDGFRDELREALARVVVSYRPNHGKQGKLHQATAYGFVTEPEKEDGFNLVYRKLLVDLNEKEIDRIRDRDLRDKVVSHVAATKKAMGKEKLAKTERKNVLAEFSKRTGIRRVRLLWKEEKVVGVHHGRRPDGKPHEKVYLPGDNHYVEIFEKPDGTWAGEATTVYDANRSGHMAHWRRDHPGACLVMRVYKGDLLKLDHLGEERLMLVRSVWDKVLQMAENREAGDLQKRHKADNSLDPFRWAFVSYTTLKDRNARKVAVDVLGRVRDPGPPK